jgi:DNA polymerase I-like protein with 3'-5' exonuclease and polymerase domains
MFRCREAGVDIALTAHDELLVEVPEEHEGSPWLKRIMEDRPQWAVDMRVPISVEGWEGKRYRK